MPKKRKPLSKFLQKYYDLIDDNIDTEEWKIIDIGDTPLYEISNHGRVRRLDNGYIINPFHSYRKDKTGNIINDRPTYLRVQLYYYIKEKRYKKHFEISRLVAIAFIPIPEKYKKRGLSYDQLEVNHIKGGYEIYNNFVSNLEWCTTKENIDHSIKTNLRHPKYGSSHFHTFLNENEVIEICELLENHVSVKDAYKQLEFVKEKSISYKQFKYTYYNIKYHVSWKFISQHYNF